MPKIPLKFPTGGLNENPNFSEQPKGTSSDMVNVRTHDALLGRQRGGRRGGLSKFISTLISGAFAIQRMIKVVRPVAFDETIMAIGWIRDPAPGRFDVALTKADGEIIHGWEHTATVINAAYDGTFMYMCGKAFFFDGADYSAGKFNLDSNLTVTASDPSFEWGWDQRTPAASLDVHALLHSSINNLVYIGFPRSDSFTHNTGSFASVVALNTLDGTLVWQHDTGAEVRHIGEDPSGNIIVSSLDNTGRIYKINGLTGALMATYAVNNLVTDLHVRSSDGKVIIICGDSETDYGENGSWSSAAANCFILANSDLALEGPFQLNNFGAPSGDQNRIRWLGTSGNFVALRDHTTTAAVMRFTDAVKADAGTATEVWAALFDPGIEDSGIEVTLDAQITVVGQNVNTDWTGAAGRSASWWQLNPATGIMVAFTSPSVSQGDIRGIRLTGGNQLSSRETSLIVAVNGDIRRVFKNEIRTPVNANAAMTGFLFRIQFAQSFGNVFMVDGDNSKYYDLVADEVKDWATDVTAGSLPTKNRLIANYRGRIFLAGDVTDPHNWFGSKLGFPFDFDFTPAVPTAITAIAGNNSETGLVGDIITALIPFADDALIFGGDQTIWQMSGDPAAGGSIDLISDKTGIAWDAWTKDPNDVLYFLGIDGIYRMEVGQKPINITSNRLDRRFEGIDLSTNRVLMEWDFIRKGLLVIVMGLAAGSVADAFFWSERDDAWYRDTFANAVGPTSLLAYDAENADDKVLLVGGRDGFLRKVDDTAADDDGNTISSTVRFTPIGTRKGTDVRLTGIEIELGEGSGPVDLKVYAGQTAEQCALSTQVRFGRALNAGHNDIRLVRVTAPWVQIELSQTNKSQRWAFESGQIHVTEGGTIRSHRR